jgi:hypothetical protein
MLVPRALIALLAGVVLLAHANISIMASCQFTSLRGKHAGKMARVSHERALCGVFL